MTRHADRDSRGRRAGRAAGVGLALLLLLAAGSAAGLGQTPAEGEEAPTPGRACAEPIPDVYDRLSPAVVFIAATSINPYEVSDRVTRVLGSGLVIDASGLIVTNAHVAFNRQSIRVTLDDGTTAPAELVGADPISDLAVLRIVPPAGTTLPTATLGDSEGVRVGEEVLAIGNPLGLDQTLTRGIVSATNRVLPETPLSLQVPLIQTDTAMNPGSSGGPLLNRCGEVIGINTAIIPDAQSIGFAIPSNVVKAALPSLIAKGRVIRPWVGFHGQFVGESIRHLLRIPLVDGFLVEVVEPGSPAEHAGLRGGQLDVVIAGRDLLLGGDIITRVDGVRITSLDRLVEATRALQVGATLRLGVFRDGSDLDMEYTLPERPLLPGDAPGQRALEPTGRGMPRGPRRAPP